MVECYGFEPKFSWVISPCRPSPPHYKTFQLRTIAALPEPAGRPTHGLLSRRSTDRISTSLLANFAQLSMFRFDELIIN